MVDLAEREISGAIKTVFFWSKGSQHEGGGLFNACGETEQREKIVLRSAFVE